MIFFATADLDPFLEQDGFVKVNARLSIFPENRRWSISLIGRNLNDQKTITRGNDTPATAAGDGVFLAELAPPRTIAIEGRINF